VQEQRTICRQEVWDERCALWAWVGKDRCWLEILRDAECRGLGKDAVHDYGRRSGYFRGGGRFPEFGLPLAELS